MRVHSLVILMFSSLIATDRILFPLINRTWAGPSLDLLMAAMSSFDLWLPFLIIISVLTLWFGGFKARMVVACALIVIGIGDGVVSNTIKKTVNRPRPNQSEANVRVVTLHRARPQFLALLKPPLVKTSQPERPLSPGRSFPSSHIMNNFAVATVLVCFYRRFGWLAFLPAALVAYSRVYVGSHWPSDAIASIFLGVSVALLLMRAISWLWKNWGARFLPQVHTRHPTLFRATHDPATASH